ncbi:type IV pilus secretin PilQ [Azoarcus taiwanensis]|uniref:Type IV pilus biogenesis and competence protein PilQ n=1 Tax=Azoarcus taiwanensis TaxID=666964 RepID=A0A972F7D5_9RHOO|nr:type IV pilus secretin PilQ [Azoarcus taiwanensis]NMG03124.1 type IV pilus secretin PilQ [Azoarcus taiwanensis]
MKRQSILALFAATMLFGAYIPSAVAQAAAAGEVQAAQNRIENLQVAEQGGSIFIRVTLAEPMDSPPASFSVANPARIAFDFPSTANALGRSQQSIEQGDLRSANIVQAGDRTRLVLNMLRVPPYETRVEGREVIIALNPTAGEATARTQVSQALANFATPTPEFRQDVRAVRDIQFRRGTDGEGRIVVELATPDTGIDIRQQGGNLVVEFLKTSLPDHLQRRSDVTDFGTPISSMTAQAMGENARLLITPTGMWEHNAYQSDTQFVLEVRRLVEDPSRLVQGVRPGEYGGEKLSLNFQNIDVRSVLQVIADFTDFNIVTSDSVTGNLTLRLQDVPWDQALDIILQAKGLDQRKTGNVIWIAPAQELADRERQQLEARAQVGDLEPLITESFQVNYHRASEIVSFLTAREQTVLSPRGTVTHDERSNKVFITDVGSRLDAVRRLINEIDIAPRQVLIEARIVEANKDFARDLGVRLNIGSSASFGIGGGARAGFGRVQNGTFVGGALTGGGSGFSTFGGDPVASFSTLNLALFNRAATRFVNLELAALESDNRGRVVSSPRVLTANQVEASIEQGTEIAYRTESSAGATTVEFKKAVLSLRVTPQITPDGRVQLRVQVNKDRPIFFPGISEPGIDTKNVTTEVLVENGGTVVIGGIYEEEETTGVARVPVLGELPVVGGLFRNTRTVSDRKELMVFITPRIVTDSLTLR